MMSALSLGMTSCSDFLEEPIRGQQDMTNYFTNETECAKQITGCYNFLHQSAELTYLHEPFVNLFCIATECHLVYLFLAEWREASFA